GYTGATLTVLDIDLSTRPARAAARPWALVGAGAAVILLGVLVGAVLLRSQKPGQQYAKDTAPQTPEPTAPTPTTRGQVQEQVPETGRRPGAGNSKEKVGAGQKAGKHVPDKAVQADPIQDVKAVGAYVTPEQWLSVLLQRQGEGFPWVVLRPE